MIERLYNEINKKQVDWERVEKLVKQYKNEINDLNEDGDALLADLYHFAWEGRTLIQLTKLFLQNGFDVHANEDRNGATCLYNLCWSTFDRYILDVAELLLEAGANSMIDVDEDADSDDENEAKGTLQGIEWRLSDWTVGDPNDANLFEAYYLMIERHQKNKTYQGIRSAEECIGEKLVKVEKLIIKEQEPENENSPHSYEGAMLFWFGETPLVVSKWSDAIVNPYFAEDVVRRIDVTQSYEEVIGERMKNLHFTGANFMQMDFDNNKRISCCNDYLIGKGEKTAYAYLDNLCEVELQPGMKIDKIFFHTGTRYSEHIRQYDQGDAFLQVNNKIIRIYVTTINDEERLQMEYLPKEICEKNEFNLDDRELVYKRHYNENGVEGLCFAAENDYFLIEKGNWERLVVMMIDKMPDENGEVVYKKIPSMPCL